jgi:hypothetical protein
MKVYIVMGCFRDYDDGKDWVEKVFDSLEKADQHKTEIELSIENETDYRTRMYHENVTYSVQVWDVE